MATDSGSPTALSTTGTVYVTVLDVNDNPPVWNTSPINLNIQECVGIGEPLSSSADVNNHFWVPFTFNCMGRK